jgi:hypothetical protein
LIKDRKTTIVVPEIIRTEWNGCKDKIVKQITHEIVEARRSALGIRAFLDDPACMKDLNAISSLDPMSTGKQIAAQRIKAIEALLDSDTTIQVPVSDDTKALAIDYALRKKAPFRMRNSMADALIFLTAAEWMDTTRPDRAVFVTHNTKDFADEQRGTEDTSFKTRLASDLQSLAGKSGLKFAVVVGRVLNDIERSIATEAEIERGQAVVERTRMEDDLLEAILSGGALAHMLEQQKKMEEMFSGGVVANMLEQQKRMEEMFSGGAIAKMLETLNYVQETFLRYEKCRRATRLSEGDDEATTARGEN